MAYEDLPLDIFQWTHGESEISAAQHFSPDEVAIYVYSNGHMAEIYLPFVEAIRLGEALLKLKE